ncbi:hypothetical protein GE061_010192 [Apolygus lucorum]|uniref:Uncharacterized protein n=1 Tax=Apolygus lucorum TaxID=248454 RepID=A0A8S9Y3W4_APOLU|nr:hypothetical protein GE061_010192 [Apolygus lucorum]
MDCKITKIPIVGSTVTKNSSAKVRNVKHETPEKLHSPQPLVEVFHGKQMNSVAHDLLGSMDDVPSLVTEVLTATADNVPSHTEYSTHQTL